MKQKVIHLNGDEKSRLIQDLASLIQDRREIVFAYLFGSFIEGLPFHDIDMGIYLSEIKEEEATLYSIDLALVLTQAHRIPVDVRVLNFAPVSFLYHVIRGKLILERDEEVLSRFVEKTIAKYLDLKPLIRRGTKEAFGG